MIPPWGLSEENSINKYILFYGSFFAKSLVQISIKLFYLYICAKFNVMLHTKRILKGITLLLFILAFSSLNRANAQNYKTGVGLRGGWASGLSIKHFIKSETAIEGIINPYFSNGKGRRGLNLCVLYEKHKMAFEVENLYWFYGAGAHVGIHSGYYYHNANNEYYRSTVAGLGIDGLIGMEYQIKEIPFTAGIDLKPYLDFIYPDFHYWDAALSIRYYFK